MAAPIRDISAWLDTLGLGRYAQVLADNDVDADALPLLTDADLRELGITSLGHRKKLLAAIAALSQDRAGETSDLSAPILAPGERRTVTVIFCDIANYTKLSSGLDPEETHALLNSYFEIVDTTITRYGGYVDKHIGDAVMGVFGAPVAHTNDPERAIRAALSIRDEVATLPQGVRVHMGIASGTVVASDLGSQSHREYTMIGGAVNLAARLEDLSQTDEILISEPVYREVAHLIAATAKPDVVLKGVESPLTVWQVEALRAETEAGAQSTPFVGPFVGRDAELATLSELLAKSRTEGAMLHLCGEAGIGKTRLLAELRTRAQAQGYECHTGLVLDFGEGEGQGAILELACSLLGCRVASFDDRRRVLARFLEEAHVDTDRAPFFYDLLDIQVPDVEHARYAAMSHAMRSQGKQEVLAFLIASRQKAAPQLLIIEDIHWADRDVLRYVEYLGRALAALPFLFVVTSRPIGNPLAELASGTSLPLTVMELQPLSDQDAAALARSSLDAPSHHIHELIARAGGNPLFLAELLRNADATVQSAIPSSVQSVVQARLDHLNAEDKRALQAASVMGQRFALAALRYLVNDQTYAPERLIAHQLIRPVAEDEYLFAHALVLEGVYASLLKSQKQELHRRAAAYYLAEGNRVLHAEHLDRAGEPGAASAYIEAARALMGDYRYTRALQLCERGIELCKSGDRKEAFETACLRGEILYHINEHAASIDAFAMAEALASGEIELCRVWLGMAQAMRIIDRIDDALALLDRAQAAAEPHELAHELARIHYLRGSLLFPYGRFDESQAEQETALGYARQVGSVALEVPALSGLGDAALIRGRAQTAFEYFDRCVELSREHGLVALEAANLCMRALTRLYRLELDEAMQDCADCIRLATATGNQRAMIIAKSQVSSTVHYEMGNWDEAVRSLEEGLQLASGLGAHRFRLYALGMRAILAKDRGDTPRATALANEVVRLSRELNLAYVLGLAQVFLAFASDDAEVSRRALNDAELWLAETRTFGYHALHWFRCAIDIGLRAGDPVQIEQSLRTMEAAWKDAEPTPWLELYLRRGRALIDHLRGARDAAHAARLRALIEDPRFAGMKRAMGAVRAALAECTAAP